MARKEGKATPKVISAWLYTDAGAIPLDTAEWYTWLESGQTFYVETPDGSYTARCEKRGRHGYVFWYGYKMVGKRQYKVYVGKSEDLSSAKLRDAAQRLADKVAAQSAV